MNKEAKRGPECKQENEEREGGREGKRGEVEKRELACEGDSMLGGPSPIAIAEGVACKVGGGVGGKSCNIISTRYTKKEKSQKE